MRIRLRRVLLSVLTASLFAAGPASAAVCRCPDEAHEPAAMQDAAGCHESPPPAPESTDSTPACQGSCSSCATFAALPEHGPGPAPTLAVHLEPAPAPAMRSGEERSPDHVPLSPR